MKIAILPARLNSKRIKRKNIKNINGRPIIYWTIKKLIKSKLFDHIIVSTDSNKISDIAIKSGASVPFLRSKKLSDDFTTTIDVIKNSIHKLILFIFCTKRQAYFSTFLIVSIWSLILFISEIFHIQRPSAS